VERTAKPRSRGAFYTPAGVVRLIVENTVGRLCEGRTPDSPRRTDIKVLDPACGEGAFLAGAYAYLLNHLQTPGSPRRILLNSIYGVDIDESALDAARLNLLKAMGRGAPAEQLDLRSNLKRGDSLLGPDFHDGGGIDWHREFPEAMERGGFDAVIGNPPWTSLAGRFRAGAYSEAEIDYLRRRFGGNSYMPNVFEYFVSQGLELTRPGGYFSFIVPDRLAFNSQFAGLRRHLLSRAELLLLVYGISFPGVTADTVIFVFRKAEPRPGSRMQALEHGKFRSTYLQSELLARLECEFPKPEDPDVRHVIRRMESPPGRLLLEDVCSSTSGFGGKSDLMSKVRTSGAQIPALKGSSIGRYAIGKRYWFDFRRENLTGRTADRAKLGASPKILIRKTGSRLTAAYDASGIYPEQSLYFLFGNRTNLDFRFILGALNSRLMGVYYRAKCLTNRRSFAQAKKADLDRVPLPPLDLSLPEDQARHDRIVELVDEMLRLHERLSTASSPFESDELQRRIGSTDRLIDRLVYELYGLNAEEIEFVETSADDDSSGSRSLYGPSGQSG